MTTAAKDPFVMFVSSVEGHLVQRYGLAPHNPIGASFSTIGGAPRWDTTAVYGLTDVEVAQHGRLYERAVREGGLKRRTRADWDAYRSEQKRLHREAVEKADADATAAVESAAQAQAKDAAAAAVGE